MLQVDAQLLEARLVLIELGFRQVELRDRRQVARLGVVERLFGEQLPREQILRSFEVELRDLEVRFALADGGLGHFLRRLGGAHLLDDFAILDLGEHLAATDGVAELHVHAQQTASGARRDVHGLQSDQVADDRQVCGHVAALRAPELHRHRHAGHAAAATRSARETAAPAAASTLRATRPALAAASRRLRTRRGGIAFAREDAHVSCGATDDGHHDRDHDKFAHIPFRLYPATDART